MGQNQKDVRFINLDRERKEDSVCLAYTIFFDDNNHKRNLLKVSSSILSGANLGGQI
jgi:hypothetical protein